jgi:hypothetical protein
MNCSAILSTYFETPFCRFPSVTEIRARQTRGRLRHSGDAVRLPTGNRFHTLW